MWGGSKEGGYGAKSWFVLFIQFNIIYLYT
jgi:hypothetical protein